ncbi:MAG: hypothetical protein P8Y67_09130, partial [Alphaproteobacteria bacterium]
ARSSEVLSSLANRSELLADFAFYRCALARAGGSEERIVYIDAQNWVRKYVIPSLNELDTLRLGKLTFMVSAQD